MCVCGLDHVELGEHFFVLIGGVGVGSSGGGSHACAGAGGRDGGYPGVG